MNARELLARDLNAMLVNGSAEIVSNGVKIVSNEDKCNVTWNDPDYISYWGLDDYAPNECGDNDRDDTIWE